MASVTVGKQFLGDPTIGRINSLLVVQALDSSGKSEKADTPQERSDEEDWPRPR